MLSSVGVALNLHYCGSKLVSISFKNADEKKCCGSKMKKKSKSCCKEKSVSYKVIDNQDSGSKFIPLKNAVKEIKLFSASENDIVKVKTNLFFEHNFIQPPDLNLRYTYLTNRVFRI